MQERMTMRSLSAAVHLLPTPTASLTGTNIDVPEGIEVSRSLRHCGRDLHTDYVTLRSDFDSTVKEILQKLRSKRSEIVLVQQTKIESSGAKARPTSRGRGACGVP